MTNSVTNIAKGRYLASKVPEISAYFWIVKILTTAMGESTSDYLVSHIDPVVAVALGFVIFAVAMILQFSVRRYIAWIYWFAALAVAIFGTMAADVLHVGFGIPYAVSATFFAVALIIIFITWYATEKTLSIHSIFTVRREIFYWLTILATFALGTAVGDLTATTLGLGYLSSGILFAVLIAVVALAHLITKLILGAEHRHQSRNAVFAFWLAYILTRPLGASFADWMGKSQSAGGLGWGDGPVALVLFIIILGFVGYLGVTKKDIKNSLK
jgi:uncharacterized membrane-anchored protein